MGTRLFSSATKGFFEDLTAHNDRDWFGRHREEYDRLVRGPLDDLLFEATQRYGSGRVARPNRDVRFSRDKKPYKTNASMWAGTIGGVYLDVDAGGIHAGGGLYEPSRDQLQRAREAISERSSVADELRTIVTGLEEHGFQLAGPFLVTAPRGYSVEDPAIELLRLKHYAATLRLPLTASIDDVRTAWTRVEPLIDWTAAHAGAALDRP